MCLHFKFDEVVLKVQLLLSDDIGCFSFTFGNLRIDLINDVFVWLVGYRQVIGV